MQYFFDFPMLESIFFRFLNKTIDKIQNCFPISDQTSFPAYKNVPNFPFSFENFDTIFFLISKKIRSKILIFFSNIGSNIRKFSKFRIGWYPIFFRFSNVLIFFLKVVWISIKIYKNVPTFPFSIRELQSNLIRNFNVLEQFCTLFFRVRTELDLRIGNFCQVIFRVWKKKHRRKLYLS